MHIKNTLLILSLLFSFSTFSQELTCQVQVLAPTLQSNPANQEIVESLEKSVYEFINNTRWTNDVFKQQEQIECNILINIKEKIGSDQFKASIQISSVRPIYNSNYKSRLFNFNDANFSFSYLRNTAIIFTPDRHSSNLSDVLAYYAYIILAYDYDSFSLEGGTIYFDQAMQIVTKCQNAPEAGWKPSEGNRNRYWLIQNALQALYKPIRKCYYEYHRNGFDNAYSNREQSLNKLSSSIILLETIHKARPNSFNVQLFFTAKADEIVKTFSPAPANIRMTLYNKLVVLDPSNISKYNQIKTGNKK